MLGCRPPIDCIVLDSSPGGAQLRVPPKTFLPADFELVIAGNIQHHAVQVWRARDTIGVRFKDAAGRISLKHGFGKRRAGDPGLSG